MRAVYERLCVLVLPTIVCADLQTEIVATSQVR